MNLRERVIKNIEERRENILNGGINCIPLPFKRFRDDWPGIEQQKYYLCTAATKAGKSQFSSYIFIFYPILYAYNHRDQVAIKIFYYPLEETPEDVMYRFMSFVLYALSEGKYRVCPSDLKSTNQDKPLNEEVLKILNSEKFVDIFTFFESCIEFSDSTNPTGVWKECKNYAELNGTTVTRDVPIKDPVTGKPDIGKKFDHYIPKNPKEYKIIYIDHISLISLEKGMDQRQTMSKLSEYLIALKNMYGFTPVVVQQQAMFESIDAYKLDKLTPSVATLADNKAISRDCEVCVSLFSPAKYGIESWMSYDIKKLKDNIRFMEVLLNRGGQSNGVLPLYFDGAVSYFSEMPFPTDTVGMSKVYKKIEELHGGSKTKSFFSFTLEMP